MSGIQRIVQFDGFTSRRECILGIGTTVCTVAPPEGA